MRQRVLKPRRPEEGGGTLVFTGCPLSTWRQPIGGHVNHSIGIVPLATFRRAPSRPRSRRGPRSGRWPSAHRQSTPKPQQIDQKTRVIVSQPAWSLVARVPRVARTNALRDGTTTRTSSASVAAAVRPPSGDAAAASAARAATPLAGSSSRASSTSPSSESEYDTQPRYVARTCPGDQPPRPTRTDHAREARAPARWARSGGAPRPVRARRGRRARRWEVPSYSTRRRSDVLPCCALSAPLVPCAVARPIRSSSEWLEYEDPTSCRLA